MKELIKIELIYSQNQIKFAKQLNLEHLFESALKRFQYLQIISNYPNKDANLLYKNKNGNK